MSMKKILAALLLMMMVFTAAGAMASANLRVRNRDMQVGQYAYVSWGNEIALSQTKPESGGYVYYRSDNVMEMHDFQFPSYGSFQYTIGVTSGSGLFTMEIYGDNLVNNAYSGQAASTATAIFCALPLEIKLMNGATLEAEATAISEGNQAIWASETLAVTGSGTLNAVGGNTNVSYQNSYGIRVGNSSGASTAMTVGSGVALNAQSGSAHLESAGIYVQGKLSSAGHITAQSGAGVSEDYAIDASAVEITAGSMTAKAADTASPAMNKAPSVYTGADVLVSKTSNAAHDPSLTYAASEIGQYTFVQVDKAKPEHAHYACGEDSCADTAHGHAAALIEYAALDPDYDDGEAWLTGTAYYLKEDIEIKNNNRIVFANAGTVYLCLNGHTITSHEALNSLTANGNLVLCDCQGDGLITRKASMTGRGMYVNGDMTMYGGKISGHSDTSIWGGGAYVGRNMTMYGGEISGNSAQSGAGGVYAANVLTMHGGKISRNTTQGNGGGVLTGSSGVINLYGGEISGNTAAKGGGLYAASGNTVNVSGAPFVMNNLAKGAENNIELSSDVNLKLTGALTGDEQTIGVTKRGTMPVQFMEAAGTAVNDAYIGKVYSDEGHLKKVDNGYGVFYDRNTISVAASPSAGGTVTGTGIYESGTSCLITAAANTGYTFMNWTDEDGNVFSTSANTSFTVTKNETLTANFKADTFTVTAQSENPAMGGVSISPAADSEGKYPYGKFVTLLATPADGYTFAGWYSAGQKVSSEASYTFAVMSNAALTARFKAVSYTITYDLAGGELPQGASNPAGYSVDSETITLVNPEKTGHTFAGWTGTGLTEATQTVTIPTGSTGNRSYTATWTVNQYTINFDTDGGSAIEPITADYGAAVTAPADPQRSGYTFAGWNPAIPQTMPAENLTVTAQWNADHSHFACGADTCSSGKHNSADHVNVSFVPYEPGMTLENGMGYYLTENTQISSELQIPSGGTIYLCLNGKTLEKTTESVALQVGGILVMCDCAETGKVTHTQKADGSGAAVKGGGASVSTTGWLRMYGGKICGNEDEYLGGGGVYLSGGSLSLYGGQISENRSKHVGGGVYANYGAEVEISGGEISRNTSLKSGGGIHAGGMYEHVKISGGKIWGNTALSDAGGVCAYAGTMIMTGGEISNNTAGGVGGGIYLNNNGTLELSGKIVIHGNTVGSASSDIYLKDGGMITLGEGMLSEGSQAGVCVSGTVGDGNTVPFVKKTSGSVENEELEAFFSNQGYEKWIEEGLGVFGKSQFTITFADTGDTVITPITADYGTAITAPANPTKTGHAFAGWDQTIPQTMPAENLTIKATWTVNQYTINFDTDGGSAIEPITADYGAAVTAPADPQRSGWTFAGWNPAIPQTMPAENLTIKATWTREAYTIGYDLAGGELPQGKSNPAGYSVDTPSFLLAEPEKKGYEFIGWTGSNGDTPQKNIGVAVGSTGNLNFTANYEPVVYSIMIDLNGGTLPEGETNPTTYTIETESFTLKNPEMEGHTFAGWTGSNGENAQPNITIAKGSTGDLSYTANYSLNTYQVSASCDPAMGTVTGSGEYGHGTQATLTAEPNAGYVFMRWVNAQGETVSEDAVYSFTVYGPCSLTAVFEAQAVNLPQTGDSSNIALWACLMMMCSACALMLARKRRA